MNPYGAMAWDHWERHRPSELDTIEDPVSFFRELGDLVEAEVTAETNLRLDPTQMTDPTARQRIRREVEEELVAAHVLGPAETDTTAMISMTATSPSDDVAWEIEIPIDSSLLARWRNSPVIDTDLPIR
jgi:hypothetical protein